MIELLLAASLAVSGCNAPHRVETEATVIGRAVEVEGSTVRYCEYFLPQGSGRMRVVYYAPGEPEGTKIAEKQIVGDEGPAGLLQDTRPQISQEDFRNGEVRQATRTPEGWRLRYREGQDSRYRDDTFSESELDVIDAGFDALVRQHWSELKAGEKLRFRFASPVHGRAIGLRAAATPCQNPDADLCIRVDLAQAFLRWIAGGEIYLEYIETRDKSGGGPRLSRFVGVTNLLDDSGDPQRLKIDYFYR